MTDRTYSALHVFAGIGGGALGFERARAEFRGVRARLETIGAIDVDAAACADLEYLTGGRATPLDLFTREDYVDFHSKWRNAGDKKAPRWVIEKRVEPPDGWRETTPADLLAVTGGRRPDVVFSSSPCKGMSGLLSGVKSASPKYQALNRLVVRWLWLVLEAWRDDPPGLILLENVPRIRQRARPLLDRVVSMLRSYGYACAETVHDCGELGGLGQTRTRFLLVARRVDAVDALLYEPVPRRLRSIGEVIGGLPAPEAPEAGAMHRLPRLKWETWVRLALIRAGKDWRDLERRWAPERWGIEPLGANCYRLVDRGEQSPTVTGEAGPSSGGLAVADPRPDARWYRGALGVRTLDETSGTVTGEAASTTGAFSIADPRPGTTLGRYSSKLRVDDDARPAHTVIGAPDIQSGALSVADPRLPSAMGAKSMTLRVRPDDKPSPTVAGRSNVWDSGGFAVADPRIGSRPRNGTMGVQPWDGTATTVTGSLDVHAGAGAVADPREAAARGPVVIVSDDGCWHRPLSTLELAALQSFPVEVGGQPLVLGGRSSTRWRMGIGNAVPPATAQAIAEQMLRTLLVADAGAFALSEGGGIWVRDPDDVLRWHATTRRVVLVENGHPR